MKVLWVRHNEKISFNRPYTWFILGLRGSGKSSFLEHVAENYLNEGHVVFDLFGSRDGENLAWLRSPYVNDKRILLLRGENVDVNCSFTVMQADKLTLHDLENHDIIISPSPLYLNIDQEFYNAAQLTDLLYKRIHWNRLVYMVVREAANFYYSRLKVSENQILAKSQMIYLIREARHCGLSIGLDSIRYYAIDIDIRNLADYLMLKAQGVLGLIEDLKWLYNYFNPMVVQKMPPKYFIIVSRSGALGLGSFPYPTWHKQEGEDILKSIGIKVEYGEMPKEAEDKGRFKTISDNEHAEIIRLYFEEMLSMHEIAERLKRSSRTVMEHIKGHDAAVERSGFCPACKRVQSQYKNVLIKQERAKIKEAL
ncbi:hypothetical protein KEJ34_07690 [Candidatus Bathyarchaeota archaeon]|nr:hypothetical protein [Candidatus Bathyarchaeota archaeon]